MPALFRSLVLVVAVCAAMLAVAPAAGARPNCDRPNPPPICFDEQSVPSDTRPPPFGHLDSVASTGGGLWVTGWAIDPDNPQPVSVTVTVDGQVRARAGAAVVRPDVAAVHPQAGPLHGFGVLVAPPRRHTSVCVTAEKVGGGRSTRLGCGRDPQALSVLTRNVAGTLREFPAANGGGTARLDWPERYRRLGAWMRDTRTQPDVIVLQEVVLRWQSRWVPELFDPHDYAMLNEMIHSIELLTGARYRIAYAGVGQQEAFSGFLFSGTATLYNVDRVRNASQTFASGGVVPPFDQRLGVHRRGSMPCERPAAPEVCGLVDPVPFWASGHVNPISGQWAMGPTAAVFELLGAPGRYVPVVNVHLHPPNPERTLGDPNDGPSLATLVAALDAATRAQPALLPPVVAGDFNGGTEALPTFDVAGTRGIDFVVVGRPGEYRAPYTPVFESASYPTTDGCGDVTTALSDHCAVFAQILPG